MSRVVNLSRRAFLRTSAIAGGGLILGFHWPRKAAAATSTAGGTATIAAEHMINAFVRIGEDDLVTVIVNHSEMGQGAYTTVPMIVADELDADWSKVRFDAAPVDPVYNHLLFGIQMTGGSTSTWSEWDRLRTAGATARRMLLEAAAEQFGVGIESLTTQKSAVIHAESGRRASYGSLASAAAKKPSPKDVPVKATKDFGIIGKPTRRLDSSVKTDGSAIFSIDVTLPGMLTAVVARSPVFGGKVKSFDAAKARAVPGVKEIVQIPRGVAVLADGYPAARRGCDVLEINWDEGELASLDSEKQRQQYLELAKDEGKVARHDGDADGALAHAAKRIDAVYDVPYLAHAAMEPLNCVADVRADRCEVWVGTQFQTGDRDAAAEESGLRPDQVSLHTTFMGGGFGRRAVIDSHFVREAVQISKAAKLPVKVIWTREDDTKGGYYRPRVIHTVSAGVDDAGNPVAWKQRVVCQSFIFETPFEGAMIRNGLDEAAVEGAHDLPYAIPNLHVDWRRAPNGVPTLWLRSVGHTHTAFVVETMIDELAFAAGKDPYQFRRGLLEKHPRRLRVLDLVAEKAGWNVKLPEGRARGIAVHESFGSFVAHVAEVSIDDGGHLKVHRVVGAIDCGPAVNPKTVEAQIESGVVFGLSAALYGEITFKNGRVQQGNFHDYRMLRMDEMPEVEAYIVPSEDKMGGVGEPGVPTVAPALVNAIFRLTGKRIRSLPIRAEDLKRG